MKKALAFALSLMLMLSLLCVSVAEAGDITGEWYTDFFGVVFKLSFNADGTYASSYADTEDTIGTWVLDRDVLTLDPDTDYSSTLTYDGSALTLVVDEMALTFTRDMPVLFAPAAARTDATLEEYAGDWVCVYVEMFGLSLSAEAAGLSVTASIDGTAVTFTMIDKNSESADDEPQTVEATFENGTLSVVGETDDAENRLDIVLLEDGMLSLGMTLSGEPVSFYMAHP